MGLAASKYLVPIESAPITQTKDVEPARNYARNYVEEVTSLSEEKDIPIKAATTTSKNTSLVLGSAVDEKKDSGIYKWLVALIGLISVASLVILSKNENKNNDKAVAKNFTILE